MSGFVYSGRDRRAMRAAVGRAAGRAAERWSSGAWSTEPGVDAMVNGPGPGGWPGLLAVAHGSRDPRHAAGLRALADAVALSRPDIPIRLGFLDLCGPDVPSALAELAGLAGLAGPDRVAGLDDNVQHPDVSSARLSDRAARIVAVPLFFAHGYHVRHDVPRAIGLTPDPFRGQRREEQASITLADPLGGPPGRPDALLLEALDRRLREAGLWTADPRLGVVLASAGSSDPAAQAQLRRVAELWTARYGSAAECAFASAAPPTVGAAISHLRSRGCAAVAVASFFLAPGLLADRVWEQARAADVVCTEPFATAGSTPAPELVRLVLRRYTDAIATTRCAAHRRVILVAWSRRAPGLHTMGRSTLR